MNNKKKRREPKPQTLIDTAHWKISPEAQAILNSMKEKKKK